jgi:hypothetical protein
MNVEEHKAEGEVERRRLKVDDVERGKARGDNASVMVSSEVIHT